MNIKFVIINFILLLIISACKQEKIAIAGSGWKEIAIVDKKSGMIEWRHSLDLSDECNDIEVTPEGNILYAYKNGARLINRNHEIIWDFKAKENEEIHTATRLKDGGFMLAVCGLPSKIIELDNNGLLNKEISFDCLIFDVHEQFRQIIKTDSDNYLIPLLQKKKIIKLTPNGQIKGSWLIGYPAFSIKLFPDGNFLISCSEGGLFKEINPSLKQFNNFVETKEIKGASLLYVAEMNILKKGHLLIANSNMYSNDKSQPLLLEINDEKEVVWTLPFNKEIKNITAVYTFFE